MGSIRCAFQCAVFLLCTTSSDASHPRTRDETPLSTEAKTPILASKWLFRPPPPSGQIPRLFHTASLDLSPSCRQTHWDWEWVHWTEEDVLDLIRIYFPWLEAMYKILPNQRYRANVARYFYMKIYGGVHADIDSVCARTPDEVQREFNISFGLRDLGGSPATAVFVLVTDDLTHEPSLSTAWMAASPGHPLFSLIVRNLPSRIDDIVGFEAFDDKTTLTKALSRYSKVYPGHTSSTTRLGSPHITSETKHQVVLPKDYYIHVAADEPSDEL